WQEAVANLRPDPRIAAGCGRAAAPQRASRLERVAECGRCALSAARLVARRQCGQRAQPASDLRHRADAWPEFAQLDGDAAQGQCSFAAQSALAAREGRATGLYVATARHR